ncbi:MAG TPA: DMT family transporter [Anaerolineae bacterium]|nr:DMT family transporter [Anaerolineae bacterium]
MTEQNTIERKQPWKERITTLLLALAVTSFWGSSFVLTKVALTEIGPMSIAWGRWLLGALALAVYLLLNGQWRQLRQALREDRSRFLVLGLVGIALFYLLQNWGLALSTAVDVGIIINSTGVFIALLSVWWLGEQLSKTAVVGITLAFAGVVLMSLPGAHFSLGGGRLAGDGLTLLAALCAAIYTVYGKTIVARYPPAVVTGLAAAVGTVFLTPAALWEGQLLPRTPAAVGALLALGVGSSALANLWWWQLLARNQAVRAGVFLFLIPVISTVLGVLVLQEPVTASTLVGGAFILGGLYATEQT